MTRIGLEASSIVGASTGIGHATLELIKALANLWSNDWAPLCVWVNSPRHALPLDPALRDAHLKILHTRWSGKLLLRGWQFAGWPKMERFTGPLDLMHSPAGYIPPSSAARRIVTVHDLYFNHAPAHVEPYGGSYFRRTYPRHLAQVDRIIAISEFTRTELLRMYPAVAPERVSVVHHGLDHARFSPQAGADDARLAPPEPYLLTVGALEPRKNLERLVAAYQRAAQTLHAAGEVVPALVLQGPAGWGEHAWQRDLENQQPKAGRVLVRGYVADSALPAIYRRATALVFPSLYEGFGLTVLEAMACGCPVALSRAAALPEIGGDAALYFNPLDEAAITAAILQICREAALREKLREAGLHRAAQFSWTATARATLEVYRDILKMS